VDDLTLLVEFQYSGRREKPKFQTKGKSFENSICLVIMADVRHLEECMVLLGGYKSSPPGASGMY
jgi:hypothetical protein